MHILLICVIRIKQFRVLTNHSIKQKANANNSTYVFPNANTQNEFNEVKQKLLYSESGEQTNEWLSRREEIDCMRNRVKEKMPKM